MSRQEAFNFARSLKKNTYLLRRTIVYEMEIEASSKEEAQEHLDELHNYELTDEDGNYPAKFREVIYKVKNDD